MSHLTFLDSVVPLPLMPLPVRTPIVHLASADILISPGSRLTAAQFSTAGRITDLVAPSFLHMAGMQQACACVPGARVWGPEGAAARFGVSRLFLRFVTDRARFEAALRKLLEWEFDDIVVSHGALVKGDGRARLIAALQERGLCQGMK